MRKFDRKKNRARIALICVCVLLLLISGGYMIHWNAVRLRVQHDNAVYSALYAPEKDTSSTADESSLPTLSISDAIASKSSSTDAIVPEAAAKTAAPDMTAVPSEVPVSAAPTDTLVPEATIAPTETAAIAVDATIAPTETAAIAVDATIAPAETVAIAVDVTLAPGETNSPIRQTGLESSAAPTPDANTIVFALETPPPIQESFAELLAMNPETVGFLTIGDWMSLPVVQRPNDNTHYLNHDFAGEESNAGTLFLDGSNLLVPEDECLIVYGHNMRNGTMLAMLGKYADADFFRENAIVQFNTIYEDRVYVPFALFSVSADSGSDGFLNFRRFDFEDDNLAEFARNIQALSILDIPIDVCYGDRLLLLVTCEYSHNNGRLILALREMREDEAEADIAERMRAITAR